MGIHFRRAHGRVAHDQGTVENLNKRQMSRPAPSTASPPADSGFGSNAGSDDLSSNPSPSPSFASPSPAGNGDGGIQLIPAATRAPQPRPAPAPSSDSNSFAPAPSDSQPVSDGSSGGFVSSPAPAPFSAPAPAPVFAPAPAPQGFGNDPSTPTSNAVAAATGISGAAPTSKTNTGTGTGSNYKGLTSSSASASNASTLPSSSASSESSTQSSGLGTGGMIGLAVGIVAVIGLIGGIIFFCARKRKNEDKEELNEKSLDNTAATNQWASAQQQHPQRSVSNGSARTAPRLSLRPVTQFFPGVGEQEKSRQQQNPFDDRQHGRPETPPSNPFDESQANNHGGPNAEAQRSGAPAPSPAVAAGPMGAAGSPGPSPPRGPNNVHRVQLDFKPSMEDELELRSGQLVRMLHEYDDGWALCTRMDRSQQGVCPRTCLSKLPVKPRQGPPPGARRGPPPGHPGYRPQSPQVAGPNGMMPRPLTPNGSRPMTPNSGRERSGSNAQRKPVPGMAM